LTWHSWIPGLIQDIDPMPTPFMHLHFAEQIKAELNESGRGGGRWSVLTEGSWPAFYFGSVAPDYQSICGVARHLTHFYGLPPAPDNGAYPRMLEQYPQLADASRLPAKHALFVAAYAVHLMLDLIWFHEILVPQFYDAPHLGDLGQRRLLHLILLTHLDKLALETLPETAGATLSDACPQRWLPFATDEQLRDWRDFLVAQLQPGGLSQTIQIYAERLRMTAKEFAAKLDNPQWMQDNLFARIPVTAVQERLAAAVPASLQLIDSYLSNNFA
jgi:hypothetical protein